MSGPAAQGPSLPEDLQARVDEIQARARSIHYYGEKPDIRLQGDVDGDLRWIMEDVLQLARTVDRLRTMSAVEMMCENENVRAHITEWEERCLKAEAELAEARRAAPPREQPAKALERLVLSLDGLLCDAEGYDKSCVRAAFLGTKGEPPFDGLPAWKRDDLLATELGARAAYYDAKAALADERAALGTDPR